MSKQLGPAELGYIGDSLLEQEMAKLGLPEGGYKYPRWWLERYLNVWSVKRRRYLLRKWSSKYANP